MTSPITQAVLKSGLISKEQLAEFRRWKAPIEIPEKLPEPPKSIEEAAQAIEQALESEGFIISRETDLDILRQYLNSQKQGLLHVEISTDDITVESKADIPVTYGTTVYGMFILPWTSESIVEEITNGMTYLEVDWEVPGVATVKRRFYFEHVTELFFGQQKAFIVCRPTQQPETRPQSATPTLPSGEDHGNNDPS
jgi:hypothetical protein